MFNSLFQLKSLKPTRQLRSAPAFFGVMALFWGAGKPLHAQPQPALRVGVVDEAKLAQARSDFPLLAARVVPQVAAKRRLSLVVSQQGLRWAGATATRVDVTAEVLALLQKMPTGANALTGAQAGAARQALAALNGLAVATKIGGLSYTDYGTRLTNASIAFDSAIRKVPQGTLRSQLGKAMQSFLEARRTWDFCLELFEIKSMAMDARFERLRERTTQSERVQLQFQEKDEREKMTQETYKPLFETWSKAASQVEAAEKLMPKN